MSLTPTANQTSIKVNIFNWNCLKNDKQLVLDVGTTGLVINTLGLTTTQTWILVPNLVAGAQVGGFTLYNPAANVSAEQPNDGQQILSGDDPTPYGSQAYCWTFLNKGNNPDNEVLWTFQGSNSNGDCMDAKFSAITDGTPVIFYQNNDTSTQQWVIKQVA